MTVPAAPYRPCLPWISLWHRSLLSDVASHATARPAPEVPLVDSRIVQDASVGQSQKGTRLLWVLCV